MNIPPEAGILIYLVGLFTVAMVVEVVKACIFGFVLVMFLKRLYKELR